MDKAPAEVYATLLDEGSYFCSTRTMYRILEESHELHERRNQLRHPRYVKPQLLATAPNQVWTWDITKLPGPVKFVYFYLYVILDTFSRYVVGWMAAEHENAALAQRLIRGTVVKYEIRAEDLSIHADRGAPMTAITTVQLRGCLGVNSATRDLSSPTTTRFPKSISRPSSTCMNSPSASSGTAKFHPGSPKPFG